MAKEVRTRLPRRLENHLFNSLRQFRGLHHLRACALKNASMSAFMWWLHLFFDWCTRGGFRGHILLAFAVCSYLHG